jgi:hypothetical protein
MDGNKSNITNVMSLPATGEEWIRNVGSNRNMRSDDKQCWLPPIHRLPARLTGIPLA